MLKKTIVYENPFTNGMVEEDHYFHISKADLIQMEMEVHKDTHVNKEGKKLTGMQAKMQRIVDAEDGKAIMEELRDFVRRSYGHREGNRFLKSPTIWEEFSATEAYSQLIWELCTNAAAAADFINGVVPSNLEQIAAEVRTIAERDEDEEVEGSVRELHPSSQTATAAEAPPSVRSDTETRILTTAEAAEMDAAELQAGLTDGRYKLS